MSIRTLEAAILRELRTVAKDSKIKQREIMEWQTGQTLKAQEGETLYYLPELAVSVAVKREPKKS